MTSSVEKCLGVSYGPSMNSPLLRKSEVCERLNVSKRSLDRLIARGQLEVVRINARVTRITPESVEDFLKRNAA